MTASRLVVLFLSVLLALPVNAAIPNSDESCDALKEFKKTFEFLKSQSVLEISETQNIQGSIDVTAGCNGSSERFKKVFTLLEKSGMDLKKTLEVSLKFSKLKDAQTEIFMASFKGLFLENKYDLTFDDAYSWSTIYAEAPESQLPSLKTDFERILSFCLNQEKSLLPLAACKDFSFNMLKIATKEGRGPIYLQFERLFDFLTQKEGPRYPLQQSLDICLQVLSYGPKAVDQFIESFKYAQSPQGLQLNVVQSFKFAQAISKNSQRVQ